MKEPASYKSGNKQTKASPHGEASVDAVTFIYLDDAVT